MVIKGQDPNDEPHPSQTCLLFWCLISLTFCISSWSALAPSFILMLWASRILGPSALASSVMIPLEITPTWWHQVLGLIFQAVGDNPTFLPRRRWSEPCNSLRPASLSPHLRWQSSCWQKKVNNVSQNIFWLVCETDTGSCPPHHTVQEQLLLSFNSAGVWQCVISHVTFNNI